MEAVPELAGLTPEEVETQKAEWSQELARVEDEIATLRVVLASKIRLSSELKRKLGISVWKEITDDVNQGIKNVKESQVYVSLIVPTSTLICFLYIRPWDFNLEGAVLAL